MPGKKKKKNKNKNKQAGGAASGQSASTAASTSVAANSPAHSATTHTNTLTHSASEGKQAASRPKALMTNVDFKKEANRSKINPIYTAIDGQNYKQVSAV
jgi:hypothetical protein